MVKEALAAETEVGLEEMTVAGTVPAGTANSREAATARMMAEVMEEARAVEKAPLRVAATVEPTAGAKAPLRVAAVETMTAAAKARPMAADAMAAAAVHSKRPLSHAHVSKVPRFVSNIVRIRLHRSPV